MCIYIFSDYLNKNMSVQQKLILATEAGSLFFSDIPFLEIDMNEAFRISKYIVLYPF